MHSHSIIKICTITYARYGGEVTTKENPENMIHPIDLQLAFWSYELESQKLLAASPASISTHLDELIWLQTKPFLTYLAVKPLPCLQSIR